jgi:hypothetical protein
MLAVGGAREPTLVATLDAMVTHQPGNAVHTDSSAFATQGSTPRGLP